MAGTVLVAGATGALGRYVVSSLASRGWRVRALSRDEARATAVPGVADVRRGDALDPATLAGAFEGCDAAFSCLGASVDPSPAKGWRSYASVDLPANRALVDAARAAGVGRFAYVSCLHDEEMKRSLQYVSAHEAVVDHLRASGMRWSVLRPTGFFSAYAMLFDMARKGLAPVIGDGSARSNPIHEADLAEACADAVEGLAPEEVPLGGPEVHTRREAVEMAFAAMGRPARIVSMPAGLVRALCVPLRLVLPRTAHITEFVAYVSTHDCVAPARGARTLEGYFRELAAALDGRARNH